MRVNGVELKIKPFTNLSGAGLRDAGLRGADLSGANLSGANPSSADLRGFGDMQRIKTLQFERWRVGYSATELQIGCQRHTIAKWRKWDTPAGQKWIAAMDENASEWASRLLPIVLALIDASPAE